MLTHIIVTNPAVMSGPLKFGCWKRLCSLMLAAETAAAAEPAQPSSGSGAGASATAGVPDRPPTDRFLLLVALLIGLAIGLAVPFFLELARSH